MEVHDKYKDKYDTPFQIFPAEIWEMIANSLEFSNDVLNLSLSAPELTELLESTRPAWMFGLIFPHVFNYFTSAEIFMCRLICKRWEKGTDRFLENYESRHPDTEYMSPSRSKSLVKNFYHMLGQGGSIRINAWDFGIRMGDHPRNPFPSRSVRVITNNVKPNVVQTFLNKFGQHIWYLEVRFRASDNESPTWIVKQIYNFLERAPNLRKFSMKEMSTFKRPYEQFPNFKPTLQKYKHTVHRMAFPKLPHLETLEFGYASQKAFLDPLIDKMTCFYSQTLRRLVLNSDPVVFSMNLPRLVEFKFPNRSTFSGMSNFARMRAPLQKIHVVTRNDNGNCGTFFTPIFGRLQRFHETLRCLIIQLPDNGGKIQKVHLPNLETLELVHGANLTFYAYSDFVYNFPNSLQCFEMNASLLLFDGWTNIWEDKHITLRTIPGCAVNYEDKPNPYMSELWEKLHRLQRFTFRGSDGDKAKKIYSREAYVYYKNC